MNNLVKTQKNKNLINFETLKPEDVFKEGGSDPIIEGLQKILDSHVPDVTTDKGRKAVASFSYSFSTSKTFLKEMGNKLTEKHKAIIKPITTERIKLEKACDSMRDQAREALNKWEEEQTRISNEKKARVKLEAAMEESRIEYDSDLISAYYDNDMFDREKKMEDFEAEQAEIKKKAEEKEEAEKAEKERLDNESRIKKETEERLKKEAHSKIREARIQRINNLGLSSSGEFFEMVSTHVGLIHLHESCLDLDDIDFEKQINNLSNEIEVEKIKAEELRVEEQKEKTRLENEGREKKEAEEALEKIRNTRTQRIYNLGFALIENVFILRSSFGDIEINSEHISVNDEAFESLINRITKRLEEDRIETEKIKAQKEQDEALEAQRKEQEEKERIEKKRLEDLKAEEDRKAKNTNHQKSVNRKVVAKLMQIELSDKIGTYLTEEQALKIASDIVKNPVPQITINYGR